VNVIPKVQILQDYAADQPSFDQLEAWLEKESEKLVIPAKKIREVVAEQAELIQYRIDHATMSRAQTLAIMVGATQVRAFKVLCKGLVATQQVVRWDPHVKIFEKFVTPDFSERRAAAENILKIYGAFAPELLEIGGALRHEIEGLSDDELDHRVAQAVVTYRSIQRRNLPALAGANGAQGDSGPVFLDHGSNQNGGRARRDESIQAVSEEAVSPVLVAVHVGPQGNDQQGLQVQDHDGHVVGGGCGGVDGVYEAVVEDPLPERG